MMQFLLGIVNFGLIANYVPNSVIKGCSPELAS